MYLENRILKIILKYQRLKSWFVRTNRIEKDKREDIQTSKNEMKISNKRHTTLCMLVTRPKKDELQQVKL